MVKVEFPAGVAVVTDTTMVVVFVVPIDVGTNIAVAPVGKPLTLNAIVPLNPLNAVVRTV